MTPQSSARRIYHDSIPRSIRIKRFIWWVVYILLFRPTPRFALESWRRLLLRIFGAKIGRGSRIAPSCFVWAPWNLRIGSYVCLADGVDCYNQALIEIGDYATVSQRSFLCTASHDINTLARPLFAKSINISPHAWICAEAFVGPGVNIGDGAIVGARAVTFRDVSAWNIVGGNPAKIIGLRTVIEDVDELNLSKNSKIST